MKLVLQKTYNEACQQACCAMLANVPLDEIISLVGSTRMGKQEHEKVIEKYHIGRNNSGLLVQPTGQYCLGALVKDNQTLWLSVSDCLDPQYGHAVLLHDGNLYDPWCGMNPMWPWSRYVARAWGVVTQQDSI